MLKRLLFVAVLVMTALLSSGVPALAASPVTCPPSQMPDPKTGVCVIVVVTPPGGTVLDSYMGSGSTGKAAVLEGFDFIGIDRDSEYCEIAQARIAGAQQQPDMFVVVSK
jgi:DNA modification methylase